MADSIGAGLARMRETHNPGKASRSALARLSRGQSRTARAGSAATSAGFAARILDGWLSALSSGRALPGASRRVALFAQTFYTLGGRASDDEGQPVTGLLALRSFC